MGVGICKYCGWYSNDHSSCKNQYKPIYLNSYHVGNLIGLFSMIDRTCLSNGDWAGGDTNKTAAIL